MDESTRVPYHSSGLATRLRLEQGGRNGCFRRMLAIASCRRQFHRVNPQQILERMRTSTSHLPLRSAGILVGKCCKSPPPRRRASRSFRPECGSVTRPSFQPDSLRGKQFQSYLHREESDLPSRAFRGQPLPSSPSWWVRPRRLLHPLGLCLALLQPREPPPVCRRVPPHRGTPPSRGCAARRTQRSRARLGPAGTSPSYGATLTRRTNRRYRLIASFRTTIRAFLRAPGLSRENRRRKPSARSLLPTSSAFCRLCGPKVTTESCLTTERVFTDEASKQAPTTRRLGRSRK